MKEVAIFLVRRGATTDELLTFADSIRNQRTKKLFIKHVQTELAASFMKDMKMQLGAKQDHLHNESNLARNRPPRSAQFALLLIPKRNREHLAGDLEEEFRTVVLPQHGRFLARCWYCEQVALAIGFYLWPTVKKILGLSVILKLIGR
jgi:hypothetical protein